MSRAPTPGLLAVTGARGRLGRALMASAGRVTQGWDRPLFDLDDPASIVRLVERDRPALVVHTAAMTATDEAARRPELAMRRNAESVEALATACRSVGAGLVLVSTNEVFDGLRDDGRGYTEEDEPAPGNAYGRSKLAGEVGARRSFEGHDGLWVVRTVWLYGPPGGDFPDKITAAADRLPPGEPLPVVADEWGSPTAASDLAAAILALVERTRGGLFHLADSGVASRYEWASAVLAARRPERALLPISRQEFERASDPPPWGVLDCGRAAELGVTLRPWRAALEAYLASG